MSISGTILWVGVSCGLCGGKRIEVSLVFVYIRQSICPAFAKEVF